jgi:hypothetical protein
MGLTSASEGTRVEHITHDDRRNTLRDFADDLHDNGGGKVVSITHSSG